MVFHTYIVWQIKLYTLLYLYIGHCLLNYILLFRSKYVVCSWIHFTLDTLSYPQGLNIHKSLRGQFNLFSSNRSQPPLLADKAWIGYALLLPTLKKLPYFCLNRKILESAHKTFIHIQAFWYPRVCSRYAKVWNKKKAGTKGDIYKDKRANIGNSFFFLLSLLSTLGLGGPR